MTLGYIHGKRAYKCSFTLRFELISRDPTFDHKVGICLNQVGLIELHNFFAVPSFSDPSSPVSDILSETECRALVQLSIDILCEDGAAVVSTRQRVVLNNSGTQTTAGQCHRRSSDQTTVPLKDQC